ncbi:hypothetical protein C0J52_20769 [Blattella germanica]|nr:hypothetical protein C0J52_20769 [Blattella germanica]
MQALQVFLQEVRLRFGRIQLNCNSILRHEIGKWLLHNRGDDYKNERNSVIHFTNVYCTVFFARYMF